MRVQTASFKFGEPIKICQTAKLKSPPNNPRIQYILLQNETSDFIEPFYMLSYIFTHCESKEDSKTLKGTGGVADYNLLYVLYYYLCKHKYFVLIFVVVKE